MILTKIFLKNTNQIKQQLEILLSSKSENLLIHEEFAKLSSLINELETTDDLLLKSQKSNQASKLALDFIEKHREDVSFKIISQIKKFSKVLIGDGKIYQATYLMNLALTTTDSLSQYESCLTAYELYTDFADNYWIYYSPEVTEIIVEFAYTMIKNRIDFDEIDKARSDIFKKAAQKCITAIFKAVERQEMLESAVQETIQLMNMGVDISDPQLVTSLAWIANTNPQFSEYCDQVLMELVEKQMSISLLEIEDQTLTGEF